MDIILILDGVQFSIRINWAIFILDEATILIKDGVVISWLRMVPGVAVSR